jgi:hypothetical protein
MSAHSEQHHKSAILLQFVRFACGGRDGLVALIADARGYAFRVGLSVPAGRDGLLGPTPNGMPSKKTARMGDEGKAVGSVLPTALLFLNLSLFVLAITSRKIEMRSDRYASDTRPPLSPR